MSYCVLMQKRGENLPTWTTKSRKRLKSTGSKNEKKRLRTGAHLRSLINLVEVDDHQIRIKGNEIRTYWKGLYLLRTSGCVFADEYWVARPERFELPTPRFVVSFCSIP